MSDNATRAAYEVKWQVKGKTDQVKSFKTDSEVKARNVAIAKSEANDEAQMGEWQVGDGPKALLIQTWIYRKGFMDENHLMSKEGKIVECPAKDLEAASPKASSKKEQSTEEDPLEVPPFLKRSKTDKPRELPPRQAEAPTPPAPKKKPVEEPKPAPKNAEAEKTSEESTSQKENTMAKTATAKKTTTKATTKAPAKAAGKTAKVRAAGTPKPAKEAAKPFTGKAPSHNKAKILEGFGAREGTNRAKLLGALADSAGKGIKTDQLLKACYGSLNEKNRGALKMVMAGARKTIEAEKLPYQIVVSKNEKGEQTIGLFAK